jgi:hypothetical protein
VAVRFDRAVTEIVESHLITLRYHICIIYGF